MTIGIIRGLGGNGGTFLARAIAAMQGVVLLSETNPLTANLFAFALNPVVQIDRNYGAYKFKRYSRNLVELGAPGMFADYIASVKAQCMEKGLRLVIRDYNYVDFIGVPFTWPTPGKSSLDAAIAKFPRKEFVLVRHPLAQYQSLVAHGELKHVLTPQLYLEGACNFLKANSKASFHKYEDIFADFDQALPLLAAQLGLPFDPNFIKRLPKTQWVTGHVDGKKSEAPAQAKRLDQAQATQLRDRFLSDPNYSRLCALSDYIP